MHCIEWLPFRKVSVGSVCEKEMPMRALSWAAGKERETEEGKEGKEENWMGSISVCRCICNCCCCSAQTMHGLLGTWMLCKPFSVSIRFGICMWELSEIKDIDLFSDWIWTTHQICRVQENSNLFLGELHSCFCLSTLLFEVLYQCIPYPRSWRKLSKAVNRTF